MRNLIFTIVFVFSSALVFAQFENLHFGTDSTLDVVTWNIEHFPKKGQVTIDYVTQIIEALDVDVVAIQEVSGETWLNQLAENLPGWSSYYAYNQYAALAFVYKESTVIDPVFSQIYTGNHREFPRAPLVVEMDFNYEHFVIVNNHFKCCGDGILDLNDPWNYQTRRYDASNLLNQFIENSHPNDKVIVVGDLNDILTDIPVNNVFQVFIDEPSKYMFTDMAIAMGDSSNWSYPTWPSHLDHILITDEIFDEFANSGSDIETIKLDDYFNSWYDYDNNVSDHRPVGIKIKTNSSLGIDDAKQSISKLTNYPNPAYKSTTISVNVAYADAEIDVYNVNGQIVKKFVVGNNLKSVVWDTQSFPAGIYYCKLNDNDITKAVCKIVVVK
jgi:endonuclease/exonuclease/phosphatase family metal-dependent hydrolase